MDFLDWIGSSISDGMKWLFSKEGIDAAGDAYKVFSSGGNKNKGTPISRTGGLMSRLGGEGGASGLRYNAEQTRAAPVVGMPSVTTNLYSNRADNDPWMGMFRRMLNQTESAS